MAMYAIEKDDDDDCMWLSYCQLIRILAYGLRLRVAFFKELRVLKASALIGLDFDLKFYKWKTKKWTAGSKYYFKQ